jgi:hypothetical protein
MAHPERRTLCAAVTSVTGSQGQFQVQKLVRGRLRKICTGSWLCENSGLVGAKVLCVMPLSAAGRATTFRMGKPHWNGGPQRDLNFAEAGVMEPLRPLASHLFQIR